MKHYLAVGLLTMSAVVLAAPKKSTSTSPFSPDVGYIYNGRDYRDLRLSNRDGSAAKLVHRETVGILTSFDVAPLSNGIGLVAYTIKQSDGRTDVYTRRFDINGPISNEGPVLHSALPFNVLRVEFSPSGERLAFATTGYTNESTIGIYDVGTRNIIKWPIYREPYSGGNDLESYPADLSWLSGGTHLAYFRALTNADGTRTWAAHRIPVECADCGANLHPTESLFTHPGIEGMDATRRGGGDTIPNGILLGLRPSSDQSTVPTISLWRGEVDPDGKPVVHAYPAKGYNAHYSCANSHIIYRQPVNSRHYIYVLDVTASSPTVFSTDNRVIRPDWVPCLPSV